MRVLVLVKHVPEPTAAWRFAEDRTLDRAGVEGRLSELDEYAVEQATRLTEAKVATEVTFLTMGPAKALDALRKALAMGGHRAVHIVDDAIHGSDAVSTSLVLAEAIKRIGFDLVLCGMASTDAEMSVIPTMIADRLGVPQLTRAVELRVDGDSVTVRRAADGVSEEVTASLPAVVSVTDQAGEARYPSFKAIMMGKKKPVTTMSLADLGLAADLVGAAASRTAVRAITPKPPREAGTVVVDEGDAAGMLADFLAARSFV